MRGTFHDVRCTTDDVRGFTLIEALIAIAILATGLVLVIEGMGRTQQALRISENLVRASQLAELKGVKLRLQLIEEHELDAGSDRGREKFPGREFEWTEKVDAYLDKSMEEEETKLNQADIEVNWKEGKTRLNTLKLSSLLLNREKKA